MKYLLLCCIDEKRWRDLPEDDKDAVMEEYGAWARKLDEDGQYVASGKLQPVSTASTVRIERGKRTVSDGPFAETKEQLGGYHLVECRDADEAISIAERIPTLQVGGVVEVRPLA